ncbi:MAG TPA: SDR family oxidoreductase [Candidatus Hydrogenedentes bacterium]|nr:SDR family oxidoreductase [Candidatus Hydrogenedentota bacterium]HIJ72518.1 SDR family oxidoreductase [Candidatus Hydrogenedentota bacterium]
MSHKWELEGKTALVTGAAKRIGRALSLALADRGVNIAVHYRTSQAEADELAEALRTKGTAAWTVPADLGDAAQAAALFARALELAGPIDILINNAAAFPDTRLDTVTPDAIHADLNVNALAPFLLSRDLAAQGREGAIVNFLDTRFVDYDRNHVAYHLSKRALFSLTRMSALEFAPAIRVNAVAPGLILPPPGKAPAYLEKLAHTNPLNRHGSPDDVVDAVLFLIESRFVTGQIIFVDGGRHMKGNVYG